MSRKRKPRRPTARHRRSAVLDRARDRAEEQGLAFTLTMDNLPPDSTVCPVFGIAMHRGGETRDNTPTLDRLVPGLGYTPENVWWICGRANRLKADATVPEMYTIADAVWAEMKSRGLPVPPTRLRPREEI